MKVVNIEGGEYDRTKIWKM